MQACLGCISNKRAWSRAGRQWGCVGGSTRTGGVVCRFSFSSGSACSLYTAPHKMLRPSRRCSKVLHQYHGIPFHSGCLSAGVETSIVITPPVAATDQSIVGVTVCWCGLGWLGLRVNGPGCLAVTASELGETKHFSTLGDKSCRRSASKPGVNLCKWYSMLWLWIFRGDSGCGTM